MENTTEALYRGATPSERAASNVESVESEVAPTVERRHLLVFSGATSWMYRLPPTGEVIIGRSEAADLRIEERSVSRQHARLAIDVDTVTISDLGSHNGTYVNKVRITGSCTLQPYDVIRIHKTTLVFHATSLGSSPTAGLLSVAYVSEPVLAGGSEAVGEAAAGHLVGLERPCRILTVGAQRAIVADPSVVQLYALIERLAPVGLPVLITGETGCGKELVATAIHTLSQRGGRPLILVNCAALHDALVESELFGHQKGAFAGAVSTKPGLIESASGSTLFLDEVGELAPAIQAKLLRVLESNRVTRVGDVREREVDVRFVAATNRDLEADVAAGRFRRDLFFRLSAATLHLPPLRERPLELPLLAAAFLDEACRLNGREVMRISDAAMTVLLAHPWPGNVRELKNLMQYVAAAVPAEVLLAEHVIKRLGRLRPLQPPAIDLATPEDSPRFRPIADELRELEITRIRQALEATGGNQTRAAGLLAMPVRTFFEKAKQYGLTPKKKRYDH
jgi:DNA-binding NtrC family response regulator